MARGKRNFEARIINPILTAIKNNLDYLTQPENLPQLAKLGYMYNTLWYGGRISFGYEGIVKEGYECEDNPKYKLEMCDVGTDEQYDWVYDAWGMHVSNDGTGVSFEEFKAIVLNNTPKEKTEIELLGLKEFKTLEDWVELMLHPDYPYRRIFPDRQRVLDHLLCTIGNGFDYKDGYIVETSSGARMNIASYGEWQSATLAPRFKKLIDKVLNDPDVKLVVDNELEQTLLWKRRRAEDTAKPHYELRKLSAEARGEEFTESFEDLVESIMDGSFYDKLDEEWKKLRKTFGKDEEDEKEKPKARTYYPICEYSDISKFDKDTHPSYIAGAIEVCRDILANPEVDLEQKHHSGNNLKFAETFMKKKFVKDFIKQNEQASQE